LVALSALPDLVHGFGFQSRVISVGESYLDPTKAHVSGAGTYMPEIERFKAIRKGIAKFEATVCGMCIKGIIKSNPAVEFKDFGITLADLLPARVVWQKDVNGDALQTNTKDFADKVKADTLVAWSLSSFYSLARHLE
jgi:hypothetical protein